MSRLLISRNADLKRLRDEGYEIEVRDGYLVVGSVPYLDSQQQLCRGTLVARLLLAGDVTVRPTDHVVFFAGEHPCARDGAVIPQVRHGTATNELLPGLTVQHSFSNKPRDGYVDYFEMITNYIRIISAPAASLFPGVAAAVFKPIPPDTDDSVFHYMDTASSRANIGTTVAKIARQRIAIVGLGGTGSYVLDLVAKTPVAQIHLFDHDTFFQHSAFRSPGAPSLDDLQAQREKVAHFAEIYGRMHKGIVAHPVRLNVDNAEQLRGMDFVFICVDNNLARRSIVAKLEELGLPFVDAGMGLQEVDGALIGQLRVTTSTSEDREFARTRIPTVDVSEDDVYTTNIQIAELNALSASLAVIKWKKVFGFYQDLERERNTVYVINVGSICNDSPP